MKRISEFKKDEGGMILVFVALFLVVIFGMTALTFDLGRMASTQTSLQADADHVALAALAANDPAPVASTPNSISIPAMSTSVPGEDLDSGAGD